MSWMLALCLCAGIGCQTTQSASMDPLPKWEYHMLTLTAPASSLLRVGAGTPGYDRTLFLEEFNRLAAEGWEYVDTHYDSVLFRRRKQ